MRDDLGRVIDVLEQSGIKSKYRSLMDIVYDQLQDDILSGKLPPNSPLNTSEIALNMKISRTPVREAINKLASVGLVNKTNHKESKVSSFMGDEIHEIYYVRAALEGLAARTAAKSMGQADKETLLLLARQSKQLAETGDLERFMENNYRFHHLIYKYVTTPLIRAVIEQFYIISRQYRNIGYELKDRNHSVSEEHTLIAESIYAGNEDDAEKYGRMHHQRTMMVIQEQFQAK